MRRDRPGQAGTQAIRKTERRGRAQALQVKEPLTARELQILGMVCDGDINREIASKLELSADGVKYHLQNIFEKLGVGRRTHAVAVAIHTGLITPEWLVYRPHKKR